MNRVNATPEMEKLAALSTKARLELWLWRKVARWLEKP